MSRGDLPSDRKAEAAAPASGVLHAIEGLEYPLQLVRRNTRAIVLHADANRIGEHTDRHRPAWLVIRESVVDEIAEHRRQELRLAGDQHAGFGAFVAKIDLHL